MFSYFAFLPYHSREYGWLRSDVTPGLQSQNEPNIEFVFRDFKPAWRFMQYI